MKNKRINSNSINYFVEKALPNKNESENLDSIQLIQKRPQTSNIYNSFESVHKNNYSSTRHNKKQKSLCFFPVQNTNQNKKNTNKVKIKNPGLNFQTIYQIFPVDKTPDNTFSNAVNQGLPIRLNSRIHSTCEKILAKIYYYNFSNLISPLTNTFINAAGSSSPINPASTFSLFQNFHKFPNFSKCRTDLGNSISITRAYIAKRKINPKTTKAKSINFLNNNIIKKNNNSKFKFKFSKSQNKNIWNDNFTKNSKTTMICENDTVSYDHNLETLTKAKTFDQRYHIDRNSNFDLNLNFQSTLTAKDNKRIRINSREGREHTLQKRKPFKYLTL